MTRVVKGFCVFVVVLMGVSFLTAAEETVSLQSVCSDMGIHIPGSERFVVMKDIRRAGADGSFRTIVATDRESTVRMECIQSIEPSRATEYIEERKYVLEALYQRIPSPYPGMITDTIECAPEFKPEKASVHHGKGIEEVYVLSSTARFTYGACADDLVQYKGGMGFLYCPGRRLLCTLEIFYPKQRFERETLLAFFASVSCSSNVAPEAPLNIIIIGLEPLGTRYMSLYGYPSRTTPALESFAQSGVVFRNAISPSSWTLPVFMSLFTSTYPSQHKLVNKYSVYTKDQQVLSDLRALSPRIVTLAQILQAQGYATAAFTGGAGVSKDFGYDAGFDVYYETPPFGGLDELVPKAVQWLKEQTGKKTFVFIMAYDLHGRYPLSSARHKALVRKLGKKFIGDVDSYWQYREKSVDKAMPALSQKDVQSWQTWYAEKIREADEKIGRFFRTLQDQGVFDHTVVVVTAGSGNEFYEHGKFDHGHSLYDELIKVPLIMRIPGVGKTAVEGQVRIIDVMPTLLDLARIVPDERVKRQMQGVSLLPMLRGKPLPLDAFSETDYLYNTFKRSLRTSDAWKFIYSLDSGDRELYDLKTDPLERRNLVESEPARAYELEQRLFDWMHSMGTDRHAHWKLLKRVLQTSQ